MRFMRWLGLVMLCGVLVGPAARAADAPAAAVAGSAPAKVEKSDWNWKEVLGVATAAIALLGTAVPQLAKSLDAYSLKSRSKSDLQRIDELAGLLEKVKKDNLLSEETLRKVCAHLEAEMDSALTQLNRTRDHRDQAMQARHTVREITVARERADLPAWRRAALLYKPHGVLAWIAHPIFYLYAVVALSSAFIADHELALGALIFMAGAWLVAWFARRRWENTQQVIDATAPRAPTPVEAGGT